MRRLPFFAALIAASAFIAAGFILAPIPATSSAVSVPQHLSECFGHLGVQFSNKDAYLCEVKLGDDPSGGLYFMVTLDDGVNGGNPGAQVTWFKLHPAPGNYYVMETMSPSGNPRSNGRQVIIDTSPDSQCLVVFPSWTETPVMCTDTVNGGQVGATHQMTIAEQSSVNEFMKNMRAAIPLEDR